MHREVGTDEEVDTERYMSTPKLNPVGYQESGVVQMDGFKHADFALAHGSGDDNGESSLPSASSR